MELSGDGAGLGGWWRARWLCLLKEMPLSHRLALEHLAAETASTLCPRGWQRVAALAS